MDTNEDNNDSPNSLELPTFNAIIVGDGAIGSALLQGLLQRESLHRAVVLGRKDKPNPEDQRVIRVRFDAEQPDSIAHAAERAKEHMERAHLVINTVGVLHSQQQQPEKRLKELEPDNLMRAFAINAALFPLLAKAFSSMLRHEEPAVLASLSARVGSIEDNRAGGWYSYRASKAAHNMLLRTLAREWRVSHRNVTVVALHPGTVQSPLSQPFVSPGYKNRVLSPQECAAALLAVISKVGPPQSGSFYDWQGEPIPW